MQKYANGPQQGKAGKATLNCRKIRKYN